MSKAQWSRVLIQKITSIAKESAINITVFVLSA